jgi:hypothetical protein
MEAIIRTLVLSLIGNPVKIGDGPAAVTSPFSGFIEPYEKGTLSAMCATFLF